MIVSKETFALKCCSHRWSLQCSWACFLSRGMVSLSCQQEGLPNPPLPYWVWKGSSVDCLRGCPFSPRPPHPPTPLRAAVAPARCKMVSWLFFFFPRLENEDSHGIPMKQHSGEIESTTKHYTNARTHTYMCMLAPIRNNTNPAIWTHVILKLKSKA